MGKTPKQSKRLNRVTGLGEAMGKAIDPVFRKRGFASRDIVTNWSVIAPAPYDTMSMPDKLHWPRGEAGAQGAILFVRCAQSHRLALSHEGDLIAAAVNRYFGYVLVRAVKLSATPFTPGSDDKSHKASTPDADIRARVDAALHEVQDDGLRNALAKLGHGIMKKN